VIVRSICGCDAHIGTPHEHNRCKLFHPIKNKTQNISAKDVDDNEENDAEKRNGCDNIIQITEHGFSVHVHFLINTGKDEIPLNRSALTRIINFYLLRIFANSA